MNETIEAIIQDLRTPRPGENGYMRAALVELADRIEDARKMERDLAEKEFVEAVTKAATGAVNLTDDKWKRDLASLPKIREALKAAGKAAREIQHVTEEFDTQEVAISIAEICERTLCFKLFSRKFAKAPVKGGA